MAVKKIKARKLTRTIPAEVQRREPEAEGGAVRYLVSLSSEAPVEIYDYDTRQRCYEILRHTEAAIIPRYMERGLPGLRQHSSWDQVSIFEDLFVGEDRKLWGYERFSARPEAQYEEKDVASGIRPYTSLGYVTFKNHSTWIPATEEHGLPTVIRERWMPLEGSHVAIPADVTTGLDRNRDQRDFEVEVEYEDETDGGAVMEVRSMDPEDGIEPGKGTAAGAGAEGSARATAVRENEAAEIAELAAAHGCSERVGGWLRERRSVAFVQSEILKGKTTTGVRAQPPAESLPNVPDKAKKRYSYARALLKACVQREGLGQFDGLEAEVHQEIVRTLPTEVQRHGGIMVPLSTLTREEREQRAERMEFAAAERAMGSTVGGFGADWVIDAQPKDFIDLLVNRALVLRHGAMLSTGLTAPVPFLKEASDMVVYAVGENPAAAVPASDVGTSVRYLTPKTLQGKGVLPRQLLALSHINMEDRVKFRLATAHGLAVDRLAIHGRGTDAEPTGIYITPGVQVFPMGGAPDYNKYVDMTALLDDKNADDASAKWIFTPLMSGRMRRTLAFAAAGAATVWKGTAHDGDVAGYPAGTSGNLSKLMTGAAATGGTEHGHIFGSFPDLEIGMWGDGLEILVDPISLMDFGQVKIVSFQMFDSLVRRGESFVVSTGATLPA